jgi:hypothetical protein
VDELVRRRRIMGLRMRKSIQICKGVRLNFGTSGASISFGTKGLRHTIHTSGRRTTSVGIPELNFLYKNTWYEEKQAGVKPYQNHQPGSVHDGNDSITLDEYNNLVDTLRSIHKTCDDAITGMN